MTNVRFLRNTNHEFLFRLLCVGIQTFKGGFLNRYFYSQILQMAWFIKPVSKGSPFYGIKSTQGLCLADYMLNNIREQHNNVSDLFTYARVTNYS